MKTFNKRINNNTTTGLSFVLSTKDVDRSGDVVYQDWDLDHFKLNPIALAFHQHDMPIGTWDNVRVENEKLVADLRLAKKGTTQLIDEIHGLVEENILKATSIGFRSGDITKNSYGGFDMKKNYLLEVSLVSVPDQQYALRKSLSKHLSSDDINRLCSVSGSCPNNSEEVNPSVIAKTQQNNDTQTKTIIKEMKMKTFADRIKALQVSVGEKQAELDGLNSKVDLTDEDITKMSELTNEITSESDRIKKFESMEKSAGNVIKVETKAVTTYNKDAAKDGVLKGLISMAKAVAENIPVEAASDVMYKGNKEVSIFAKAAAAAAPAMTNVPEWAGDLTREGYGAYLEDLVANTVFGQVAGLRINFGKDTAINIPYRDGTGTLAGDFILEGDPIPVKQDKFATVKLAPSKLGVITTFTKEIMKKSTPAIEGLLKNHMVSDTADVLDTRFLDATAASATRPAGLEAGAGVANIVASTGATVGDIEKDIQGVFDRLSALKMGGSGTIIMNPSRKRGLNFKQNALGQYPFRGEGILEGFNIVTSINVPADKVYFIDSKALAFGIEQGVEFDVSTQATLVMSAPAEAIGDGTKVTAEPIRSMFQTDTIAIKQTLALTWKQLRAGGVQILTGVTW